MNWIILKEMMGDLEVVITYKTGDILIALGQGDIDIFGHGCNCRDGFGAGIVTQIAKKYPEVEKRFHYLHDVNLDILGTSDIVETVTGQHIANLYIQETFGRKGKRYCSYDAIATSLTELAAFCEMENMKCGLPKIGAGLGGGEWKIIESIIDNAFRNSEVIIYEL